MSFICPMNMMKDGCRHTVSGPDERGKAFPILFFRIALAIRGLPWFRAHLRTACSSSAKASPTLLRWQRTGKVYGQESRASGYSSALPLTCCGTQERSPPLNLVISKMMGKNQVISKAIFSTLSTIISNKTYKISLIMLDFQGLFSSLELVLSFSAPRHQINNYPSGGAELHQGNKVHK